MTLGERIKSKREELDISQAELARKICVTKQTVYKYENGIVTNIPYDKIEAISKALKVSPSYLMAWEPEAADRITLYNMSFETENECELIISYRGLSDNGKKRISTYVSNLLNLENADKEANLAKTLTDINSEKDTDLSKNNIT